MKVARSGIGWLMAKYGVLVLSFITVMVLTRLLPTPAETLGKFQLFETGVSITMLLTSAGLSLAVTKRLSEGTEREAFVGATLRISIALLLAVTVLILLFAKWINSYFGEGFTLVLLLIGAIWMRQGVEVAVSILRGYTLVGRSGVVEFVEMLVRSLVTLGLVFLGFELFGLIGGVVVGATAAVLIAFQMIPAGVTAPNRHHYKRLLSFTKYSFFTGFANKVYNNIDIIVIGFFVGPSGVALYSIPYRLTLALDAFSSAINGTLMPAISEEAMSGDRARIRELLKDGIVFSMILAIPAVVGVGLLAKPIIVTLFTSSLSEGAAVAIIAMVIQIPSGLRSVFLSLFDGIDRPDITLKSNILLIIVNGILDLVLVPTVGIEGAALATLVGISLATAYLGFYLFRILNLSTGFFPIRPIAAEVLAAGVMGILVHLSYSILPFQVVLKLILVIPLGVMGYAIVLVSISGSIRRRVIGISKDFDPR